MNRERECEPNFRPLRGKLVVKIDKRPNQTKSGLFMPDERHPDKFRQGTVIAVGDGRMLKTGVELEPEVKLGDRIIFNEYEGTKTEWLGDQYLHMKEESVWSIFEGEIELHEVTDRG